MGPGLLFANGSPDTRKANGAELEYAKPGNRPFLSPDEPLIRAFPACGFRGGRALGRRRRRAGRSPARRGNGHAKAFITS
jgi:hypothetical protein